MSLTPEEKEQETKLLTALWDQLVIAYPDLKKQSGKANAAAVISVATIMSKLLGYAMYMGTPEKVKEMWDDVISKRVMEGAMNFYRTILLVKETMTTQDKDTMQ